MKSFKKIKATIDKTLIYLVEKFLTLALVLLVVKIYNLGYISEKLDSCNRKVCKPLNHAFDGFLEFIFSASAFKWFTLTSLAKEAVAHEPQEAK